MKDSYHRHSQFELFPGAIGHSVEKDHSRVFLRSLAVSFENLFILAVILIMGLVVAFSLGVERGKKVGRQQQPTTVMATDLSSLLNGEEAYAQVKVNLQNQPSAVVAQPESAENRPEIKTESTGPSVESQTGIEKKLDIFDKKLYTVQVASFRQEKYAQEEAQSLKAKGYEIFVVPKGKYSIVCVGKFAQRDEAQIVSQSMKKQYKDCLVRSL